MKLVTGQVVTLIDCKYHLKLRFIVEEKNKGQHVCLARPHEPYHRLHVAQNGTKVSFIAGPQNHGSFFNFIPTGGVAADTDMSGSTFVPRTYRLQSVALSANVCIGVGPDGTLHAQAITHTAPPVSVPMPVHVVSAPVHVAIPVPVHVAVSAPVHVAVPVPGTEVGPPIVRENDIENHTDALATAHRHHSHDNDLSIDFHVTTSTTGDTTHPLTRSQGPSHGPPHGPEQGPPLGPLRTPQGPLQPWEVRRFVTEGYIIAHQCVQAGVLQRCARKLTHALSIPGAVVAGGTQGAGVGKLAGCYSNCKEVRDLFLGGSGGSGGGDGSGGSGGGGGSSSDSGRGSGRDGGVPWTVLEVVEFFLGPGNVDCSAGSLSAQIAFRFPELVLDAEDDWEGADTGGGSAGGGGGGGTGVAGSGGDTVWHTDGLRQGKSHPFSLLVGVCLSDVTAENAGNLLVWPGSHLLLHPCKTNRHGALDLDLLARKLAGQDLHVTAAATTTATAAATATDTTKTASDTTPTATADRTAASSTAATTTATSASDPSDPSHPHHPHHPLHNNEPPHLPHLGPPVQVLARAGDVVLLHPDLAHAGGPNRTDSVRKMVYFRIRSRGVGLGGRDRGGGVGKESGGEGAGEGVGGGEVGGGELGHSTVPRDGVSHEMVDWAWARVCEEHGRDMWVDLPGVRPALAHLQHTAALYALRR